MNKPNASMVVSVVVLMAGLFALAQAQVQTSRLGRIAATRPTRTYVIPQVLEKSGTITNTQYTFDTTIFMTYTPGLANVPAGPGATVDLYLYDQADAKSFMMNNGQPVCNPCTFLLDATTRFRSVRVDDLITAKGGNFDKPVKLGFGVLVVGGQDPNGVNLQGFVVNSHTNAFDLSVFGFEPQPIAAAAQ